MRLVVRIKVGKKYFGTFQQNSDHSGKDMLHRAFAICFISVGICITICQATGLGEACAVPGSQEPEPCTTLNSKCKDDTCQCMDGYTEEEGECKISLEKECTQDSDCVSNSICLGNIGGSRKCTCAEGYFAKDGLCSKVIGTACTSSTESTVCALRNTGCKDGVCACNLGYNGIVNCSLSLY
ncbi:tenascin-X-like [Ruditapes philippinarum]|uniref:tenascin-X-like n=1 Tax=Ruditapes philippinarum TaxID=129788 RepID=UPI00295ADC11|nr:tenascin-X-like [Ruditapes philippinarum]